MSRSTASVRRAQAQLAASLRKPMPRRYELMLVTLVEKPFDDPEWIFEPKYDGLRVLARWDGKKVELLSRNYKSQNIQFPDIVQGVLAAVGYPTAMDGEIVCLDESGRSSFRKLQQRFHLLDAEEIRRRAIEFPAYLYVFDILYWNGYELISLPLEQRKQILSRAVGESKRVRVTPHVREHGIARFRDACRRHEEGIVGKHLHSPYVTGRPRQWVKIKCASRQEFVIGGVDQPAGRPCRFGRASRRILQQRWKAFDLCRKGRNRIYEGNPARLAPST